MTTIIYHYRVIGLPPIVHAKLDVSSREEHDRIRLIMKKAHGDMYAGSVLYRKKGVSS